MKSFTTRVISALVALAVLLILYFYFPDNGFKFLVSLAPILGGFEVVRILFADSTANFMKYLFYVFNLAIFFTCSFFPAYSGLALGLGSVLFLVATILGHGQFAELKDVRDFATQSILGFVYIGLLPSFAWRCLDLPHGMWWFWLLLGVVFGGDIGAYAFGVLWGKTKFMPKLSPKKSVQGSIGGLTGSVVAVLICYFMHPYVNWQYLVPLALVTGFVGQMGDYFESLLKRVADIKDSGKIMPGHGGVLDRIDGVIFASPVLFLGALILEQII